MISTRLDWVDGPWPGRLALAARPRGGEWLEDELAAWRNAGVDTVFSLLMPDEENELGLEAEQSIAYELNMDFVSFPILDRQVPESVSGLTKALEVLDKQLTSGRNVVLHCRQGIGRTGLVAACLLVTKGLDPDMAVNRLSAARGTSIPETPGQRSWIDRYAMSFVH